MIIHVLPIFCLFGSVDLPGDHLASFHQLKERTAGLSIMNLSTALNQISVLF